MLELEAEVEVEVEVGMACVGSCSAEGFVNIGHLCRLQGCGREVHRDARGGRDFCGRTHALEDMKQQQIVALRDEQRLPCLVPNCAFLQAVKEDGGYHPFCSWRHAKQHGVSDALDTVLQELQPVPGEFQLSEVQLPRAEAHDHDQAAVAHTSDCQLFVQKNPNQVHFETSVVQELWTAILAAWPHDGFRQEQLAEMTILRHGINQLHPWELIRAHVEAGPRLFLSLRRNNGQKDRIDRMTKDGLSWRQSGKPVSDHQNWVRKQSFSYRATEGKKTKDLEMVRIFTAKESSASITSGHEYWPCDEVPSGGLGQKQKKKRKREVNFRYLMTEFSLMARPSDLPAEAHQCAAGTYTPVVHAVRQNISGFPDYPPRSPDAPAGRHNCERARRRRRRDEEKGMECGAPFPVGTDSTTFTPDLSASEGPAGPSNIRSGASSVGQFTDASEPGSSMRRPEGGSSCVDLSAAAADGLACDLDLELSDWENLLMNGW